MDGWAMVGRWAFLDVHRWHGMAGMHLGHVRAGAGEDNGTRRGRREETDEEKLRWSQLARHQCITLDIQGGPSGQMLGLGGL